MRRRIKEESKAFLSREINIPKKFKSHFTREFCNKHIIIFRQSDRKSFEVLYEIVSNINWGLISSYYCTFVCKVIFATFCFLILIKCLLIRLRSITFGTFFSNCIANWLNIILSY